MNFTRNASAHWEGTGKEGKGTLSTATKALDKTRYSFNTRFEDGSVGTNPEELIGAAHAGCYTMQLSFLLSEEGFKPSNLDTKAKVTFEDGEITKIHLDLKGEVDNISADKFKEIAEKAKKVCPVSKLVKAEVSLNAELIK